MNGLTVAKFGGTSLATVEQVRKVIDIIMDNPARQLVVVSAPGARSVGDKKVTDLLYRACSAPNPGIRGEYINEVQARFVDIAQGLGAQTEYEILKRFEYVTSLLEVDLVPID
jgi:aspartate kinase